MNNLFDGFYKGKTVFVTGHTGFQGSWLSLWLTLLGANVVVVLVVVVSSTVGVALSLPPHIETIIEKIAILIMNFFLLI